MGFMELAKNIVLTISIVVILSMFLNYGFSTFKKAPLYEDFCNESIRIKTTPVYKDYENLTEQERLDIDKMNEYYIECQKDYELARENYERPRFIFLTISGIIAIIIGGLMISIEGIGIGILGGGVVSIISGSVGYWRHLSDYIRFLMLGIALFVLIWVGVKVARKSGKNKDRKKIR